MGGVGGGLGVGWRRGGCGLACARMDNGVSAARLAQSAERKALNLVVVGSSPTVGVTYLCKGVAALEGVINQIRS